MTDVSFMKYIDTFEIVCLLETFVADFDDVKNSFPNFKLYFSKALKISNLHGRCSGGVVVLVKKSIFKYIRINEIKHDYHNIIALKLSDVYLNAVKDVILISAYVPPYSSQYYTLYNSNNGIHLLEDFIVNIKIKNPHCGYIISGDLNARTSSKQPMIECENVSRFFNNTCPHDEWKSNEFDLYARNSEDHVISTYGASLIELCASFNLIILNGLCDSDLLGNFTNISPHGNSVVDYFIVSECLMSSELDMKVDDNITSWHMPIILYVSFNKNMTIPSKILKDYDKIIWDKTKLADFITALKAPDVLSTLKNVSIGSEFDVNNCISPLCGVLMNASHCMKKKIKVGTLKARKGASWFDMECKVMKKCVKKV